MTTRKTPPCEDFPDEIARDASWVRADLVAEVDQATHAASKEHWAKLIDAFEPRHSKLAALMRRAEDDVLAYKSFPKEHWAKSIRRTRLNL